MGKSLWAIGLMSGTSLDGIDAALIRSDGETIEEIGPALTLSYEPSFRHRLRAYLGQQSAPRELEQELTRLHAKAVEELLSLAHGCDVQLIGFHGQTLYHDPANRITCQIGDGALLARLLGIDVVNDFRSADVAAGGQGAPLVPVFHSALTEDFPKPLAILNIGGVANVTWIGEEEELLAFDTGPGNALMDDWVNRFTKENYDSGGVIAARGAIDEHVLAKYLAHPYFDRPVPKSLDRNAWALPENMTLEDGAATLAAFTVASIGLAQDWFPYPVNRWLVAGGGRHNRFLMGLLEDHLGNNVQPVESVGWDGDSLEAQAFAFLAVRSFYGLPLSFPETTGVKMPLAGGRLFKAC